MTEGFSIRDKIEDYSKEELIAEFTATYVLANLGIVTEQSDEIKNSESYIRGWLKALKDDPNMLFTALEVVNASVISSTSNVLQGTARVIALPWLADATTWYLLKTDGVVRPFIFQDREPLEFGSLTEDSEEGFKREKLLFGVRARYRMAYGYWQYAVRVVFN